MQIHRQFGKLLTGIRGLFRCLDRFSCHLNDGMDITIDFFGHGTLLRFFIGDVLNVPDMLPEQIMMIGCKRLYQPLSNICPTKFLLNLPGHCHAHP